MCVFSEGFSSTLKPNGLWPPTAWFIGKPALESLEAVSRQDPLKPLYIEMIDDFPRHLFYFFFTHAYSSVNFLFSSAVHLSNMPILTAIAKLLLVGMTSVYCTLANDEPSTFPEVLPGPGMPSLTSMGLTTTSLYTQAHALLSKFRFRSSCHEL